MDERTVGRDRKRGGREKEREGGREKEEGKFSKAVDAGTMLQLRKEGRHGQVQSGDSQRSKALDHNDGVSVSLCLKALEFFLHSLAREAVGMPNLISPLSVAQLDQRIPRLS